MNNNTEGNNPKGGQRGGRKSRIIPNKDRNGWVEMRLKKGGKKHRGKWEILKESEEEGEKRGTKGYKGLQRVTKGYKGVQRGTKGFKGTQIGSASKIVGRVNNQNPVKWHTMYNKNYRQNNCAFSLRVQDLEFIILQNILSITKLERNAQLHYEKSMNISAK